MVRPRTRPKLKISPAARICIATVVAIASVATWPANAWARTTFAKRVRVRTTCAVFPTQQTTHLYRRDKLRAIARSSCAMATGTPKPVPIRMTNPSMETPARRMFVA